MTKIEGILVTRNEKGEPVGVVIPDNAHHWLFYEVKEMGSDELQALLNKTDENPHP